MKLDVDRYFPCQSCQLFGPGLPKHARRFDIETFYYFNGATEDYSLVHGKPSKSLANNDLTFTGWEYMFEAKDIVGVHSAAGSCVVEIDTDGSFADQIKVIMKTSKDALGFSEHLRRSRWSALCMSDI